MCRRIVVFFKTELVRLRDWIFSRVLKMQRIYRGHVARLIARRFKADLVAEKALTKYKSTLRFKRIEDNRKYSSHILKSKYSHERNVEFTARATSRLETCDLKSKWEGKRFACFDGSMYADVKVNHQIDTHVAIESEYQYLKSKHLSPYSPSFHLCLLIHLLSLFLHPNLYFYLQRKRSKTKIIANGF